VSPIIRHNGPGHGGATSGEDLSTNVTNRDTFGGAIAGDDIAAGVSVTAIQNAAPPTASPATVNVRTAAVMANPL
jgi:hypothetical protein